VKQLSSRWAAFVLLVPVFLVLSILIAGHDKSPQAASSGGKGFVQIAFTGAISGGPANFPNYQSVMLNVIAVRFNPTTLLDLSDADPVWQTVAVAPGTTAGSIFPTLSFGGNFGPNGNAVGIGQGRSVMQIDLAQLQNNLTVFNTGRINAETYQQVELLLDSTPGTVTPICGAGTSVGEGCISYQTQFPPGFLTVRFPPAGAKATPVPGGLFTVTRNTTTIFPIAINAVLPGAAPVTSTDKIQIAPEICPLPLLPTSNPISCTFSSGSPPPNSTAVGAIVSGHVTGANSQGVVRAELAGTGTVISSASVDNTTTRNYTMIMPAGDFDLVASSSFNHTIDAQSGWVLTPGQHTINFTVKNTSTRTLNGTVSDGCSGAGISGATVEIFGPPTHVGGVDCASPAPAPTPAGCVTSCDSFASGAPPAGCVILGSSSSSNLGAYPFSPSGAAKTAFSTLPISKSFNYGLRATASGFNGRLLAMKDRNGLLKCDGSGFKDDVCSFGLKHGTFKVTTDAGSTVTVNPLNVLVDVEDQGTFNGEALDMVTIPVGQTANLAPAPILVPIFATSPAAMATAAMSGVIPGGAETAVAAARATPTPTGTPVDIGGAANYDLFASVQDLFGAAPQKVTGHKIAVLSGIPAPSACATAVVAESLTPLTCVGHGSVQGSLATVDQRTLLVVSKNAGANPVQISSSLVPLVNSNPNFSVCEPVDNYTLTHFETQPTGSPTPIGSAAASLSGPITIPFTSKAPCFSICNPPGAPTPGPGGSCLLCQQTGASVSLP
jgi:hypothetical protein